MIRYPGSKDKIVGAIRRRFPDHLQLALFKSDVTVDYREPFFGAGAVGFSVLPMLDRRDTLWINDVDRGVACLWKTVIDAPADLCALVRAFRPTVEAFYQFRAEDGQTHRACVETAFRKLALHQLSFSGLGAKAGGPIGGRRQSSAYNVDCRWNPSRICLEVMRRSRELRRLARVTVTRMDFSALIQQAPTSAFIYADPPYVGRGPELYKYAMTDSDHRRLAADLQSCRAEWVLSYDDHPLIRELYDGWAEIESVEVRYTMAVESVTRRKNAEVIITRKD